MFVLRPGGGKGKKVRKYVDLHAARTDVPHFAAFYEVMEGLHGFFDWGGLVEAKCSRPRLVLIRSFQAQMHLGIFIRVSIPMNLEQVNVGRLEPGK